MSGIRVFAVLSAALFLAACGGPAEPKWAPDAAVAKASYQHDGPPTLTLFTVINNKSGAGAHSALMVNATQRAIFDPAGTWYHPNLPERNDVHFGMTDPAVHFYVDYHSRTTHHTVIQKIVVSEEVARLALAEIMTNGAVPKAQCSIQITGILQKLPGFETIKKTWFPKQTSAAFAQLPGVTTEVVYDNDASDNSGFIVAYGI